MGNGRRISTGLSEPERLHELLWQAIRAPGMNPENVYLLLRTVLDREYPDGDDLEDQSKRFRKFLQEPHPKGLGISPDQLLAVLHRFRHPHEDKDAETREWMGKLRERLARLLPGRAGRPHARTDSVLRYQSDTAERIMRRLNRDRPDLARAVAEERLSANAAAIEAGFRRRKVSVPVDSPEAVTRTLRRHMSPEDLALVAKLITEG
jgi:hypothetical protein